MDMKGLKSIAIALICASLASCVSKNEHLEKLIPSDVAGVVCVNMPNVIEKSGIKQGDDLKLPDDLKDVLKANEESALCRLVKNMPNVGLEIKEKAFVYFPKKDFDYVMLAALADEDKAKNLITHKTGCRFEDKDGVDIAISGNDVWAVSDGVLLKAVLKSSSDADKASKLVSAIINYDGKSIADVPEANVLMNVEKEITAYFDAQSIEGIMKSNPVISTWVSDYPILHLLVDNDVKSLTLDMSFNDDNGEITADLNMDDNCQFAQLLDAVLQEPSNDFLATIPNSMQMVMSMSVNGANLVRLPQVNQMLRKVNEMPFLGSLRLDSMVNAISGPIAVGVLEDPYFEGDYNYVFAAESSNPLYIVDLIARFASKMGQDPEVYEDEYIYSYNNKQVKVGVNGNVVYIKMLNYEQTEGYANTIEGMNALFGASNLGIYCHITDKAINSTLSIGLMSKRQIKGTFVANNEGNAMMQFIKLLCSIEPVNDYDYDMSNTIESDNMVGEFHAF